MSNKKSNNNGKLGRLIKDVMAKAEKEKSIVPTLAEISKMVREGEKIIEDEMLKKKQEFSDTTEQQKYQKVYAACYNQLTSEEKQIVDSKKEGRVLTTFIKRVIVLAEELINKKEQE